MLKSGTWTRQPHLLVDRSFSILQCSHLCHQALFECAYTSTKSNATVQFTSIEVTHVCFVSYVISSYVPAANEWPLHIKNSNGQLLTNGFTSPVSTRLGHCQFMEVFCCLIGSHIRVLGLSSAVLEQCYSQCLSRDGEESQYGTHRPVMWRKKMERLSPNDSIQRSAFHLQLFFGLQLHSIFVFAK